MDKKTIIFGLMAIILVLIVVLTAIYYKPSQQPITPPPIPIFSPSPSAIIYPPNLPKQLAIIDVYPAENTSTQYYPYDTVSFTFNDTVRPEDFYYTVSPEVKTVVKAKVGTATLMLYPEVAWAQGITTITVLEKTKSTSGGLLGKKFIYKLNAGEPENINLIEH